MLHFRAKQHSLGMHALHDIVIVIMPWQKVTIGQNMQENTVCQNSVDTYIGLLPTVRCNGIDS